MQLAPYFLIIVIVDDRARLIPCCIKCNTDKTRCGSAGVCMGGSRRADHAIVRGRHESPRQETVGKRVGVHVEKRPQSKKNKKKKTNDKPTRQYYSVYTYNKVILFVF